MIAAGDQCSKVINQFVVEPLFWSETIDRASNYSSSVASTYRLIFVTSLCTKLSNQHTIVVHSTSQTVHAIIFDDRLVLWWLLFLRTTGSFLGLSRCWGFRFCGSFPMRQYISNSCYFPVSSNSRRDWILETQRIKVL